MIGLFCFVLAVLASPFKSKLRLEAENAVLRHQLIVLRRKLKGRARLTNNDPWFFVQMYRCFPSILKVVTIVQPETLESWYRAGFRRYWAAAGAVAPLHSGGSLWTPPRFRVLTLGVDWSPLDLGKIGRPAGHSIVGGHSTRKSE
jgi:hypothetical protein